MQFNYIINLIIIQNIEMRKFFIKMTRDHFYVLLLISFARVIKEFYLKKLMILGADIYQVPLIKKAKSMGHQVITVDYIPGNIGHKYSDTYVNCSTIDKDYVLRAAKAHKIDGIITFASDVAVSTVAYVADILGLKGVCPAISRQMINKQLFRQFQNDNGLNAPDVFFVKNNESFNGGTLDKNKKYVVKPIDTSGSRGISFFDNNNQNSIQEHLDYARRFSRNEIVLIEEFIEGIDVTGEGFVHDGKIKTCFFTRKIKKGFIPIAHIVPAGIEDRIKKKLFEEMIILFNKIGYKEGPFDFDAIVTDNKVYIIEISPRLGGNGVPIVISYATRNDYLEFQIKYSLGELGSVKINNNGIQPVLSYIFGSDRAGIIQNLPDPEEIINKHQNILEIHFRYRNGEQVGRFENSSNSIGYSIINMTQEDHYHNTISKFNQILDYKVV